jgi:hypothetical protein
VTGPDVTQSVTLLLTNLKSIASSKKHLLVLFFVSHDGPAFPFKPFLDIIAKLSISKMSGHVYLDDIEPNPTQAINT